MEVLDAKFLQLRESTSEVRLPALSIISVKLNPGDHFLISQQSDISRQHDDTRLALSHEDFQTVGLLSLMPLHGRKVYKESVIEIESSGGPRSDETAPITVAHTDGMSSGESNDLLIGEAHPVEDASQMGAALGGIGQSTIGYRVPITARIRATRSPLDLGASHNLDCANSCKTPEISVGQLLMFSL